MIELSEKGGITYAQASKLGDKKVILENISWKPDVLTNSSKRIFFPYLDIKFVKPRLIEICGAGNIQFMIEKDKDIFAIGNMGIYIEGEWVYNSSIGVEREASSKLDKTKQAKVKYKGNHADAYKSCAELFGLVIPAEVKPKMLKEENKSIFSLQNKKIGHLDYDKEAINAYLNNINKSFVMLAQVHKINKEVFDAYPDMDEKLKELGVFLKEKGV